MRCPECAYPNLPISFTCDRCDTPLRAREEVEKAIKQWSNIPESERAEFERKFRDQQVQFNKYPVTIKRNRFRHAIIGGLLGGSYGLLTGWFIIPDIIFGGLAGYELTRREGGQYTGMILFVLAYTISSLIKGKSVSCFGAFYVAIWAGGAIASLVAGSFFGIHLSSKRLDA